MHILFPNLDLNNPGIDAAVAQGWIPGAPGKGKPPVGSNVAPSLAPAAPEAADVKSGANLESMVRAVAELDLDESGHWDYHGHSSGFSFVRRMREQLGDIMGPEIFSHTTFIKAPRLPHVLDSPRSMPESPSTEFSHSLAELPPKELAKRVCGYAVKDAASLLPVVHKPTFWASFERIYNNPSEQYTNEDHVFLPLFYSAMALGSLFDRGDANSGYREGYESATTQGLAYFKTARHMMDIADCRDLPHIQAVVFMIFFLQSTARLSQCYAYVGIALRSACRMGLHRSAVGKFNPIESETRKRLFWTIHNMDAYVGLMIGLPLTLREDDIDQDLPAEVDDEYITCDGILPMPEGEVSLVTACNSHTRLVAILIKIMRTIYPIKFPSPLGMSDKSYSVPFASIREIESELEQWKNSLPPILTPSDTVSKYTRVQQLLRLTYAHAQVMLYRPFLHFVDAEKRSKAIDQRAYACAASFVNVSRNIIHIQTHMKQKGLLNGAYWFGMYTTFFSILALVYFAAENPDQPSTQAVMKDAIEGKEVLKSLASKSMAADRCSETLELLFARLPAWMREGQANPVITKKRPHHLSQSHTRGHSPNSRSQAEISQSTSEPYPTARRAATFPKAGSPHSSPSPFDPSWSQGGPSFPMPPTPTSASFDPNVIPGMGGQGMQNTVNAGMPSFPTPSRVANPAITDMSTMMFPVADEPLVYPNQPLTTFENNTQYGKPNNYMGDMSDRLYSGNIDGNNSPVSDPRVEEDIEAQFYALPPYMQQNQQMMPQQHQQQHPSQQSQGMPYAHAGNGVYPGGQLAHAQTMPIGTSWNNPQPNPQQDINSISISALFGGSEWNAMGMPAAGFPNPL